MVFTGHVFCTFSAYVTGRGICWSGEHVTSVWHGRWCYASHNTCAGQLSRCCGHSLHAGQSVRSHSTCSGLHLSF